MRRPQLLIMSAAVLAGVTLTVTACTADGDEQATAPVLVAVTPNTVTPVPETPTTVTPVPETPTTGATAPTTRPGGGTDSTTTTDTPGPTEEPTDGDGATDGDGDGDSDGDSDGDGDSSDTPGDDPDGGGQPPDYDLLVFPIHAVVSQACRDQGDFPRIFQAGNPSIVLDTFGRNPLQTSVFSENIWVPIHGGPTDPQIELGSGQTALTTLLRATADGEDGHQVALSVFGFVSGGIEIRWTQQTRGFGPMTSPRFHPLNDSTSPCWVQLNTAVVKASP